MKFGRAFLLANVALVALSALAAYYLATASYAPPSEIATAQEFLKSGGIQESPLPPTPVPIPDSLQGPRKVMEPLFALPPTPSPTPRPSPTPIPLANVLNSWTVVSLDVNMVTVQDTKSSEEFELTLNGPGKDVDFQGQTVNVKLCRIDLEAETPSATFCALGQSVDKTF